MKVSLSVYGRFHAFFLASELQKHKALHQLITSYPTWEVQKYAIGASKVTSLVWLEGLARFSGRLPRGLRDPLHTLMHSWFDRTAALKLSPSADIFVGFAGQCYQTLQTAKEAGAVTVVERHSSHIAHQTELLATEYERFGFSFADTIPAMFDQEIKEYATADYLSVPSEFVKQSLIRNGVPEHKILLNPLGVNTSRFFPHAYRQRGEFRVIFCGHLSLQKGIPYLLEAFARLKLKKAELWLVGSTSEEMRPILSSYLRNHPSIKHWDHVPEYELPKYYDQCDLFCLPSIQDGFGMVVPQAMACGLPILCSENTGAKDLLREGIDGFIVPIRDVEALQEKISWCYHHHPQTYAMGKAALEKIKKAGTWTDYGNRMVKLYGDVLKSRQKLAA